MWPIRIVLGEDHSLVREGTRRILEQRSDMVVVGEAGDGQQVLDLIERLQPEVAVLDIRMPTLSGIEVARQVRERAPNTRVLMLTAYDDDDYILTLMELGVSGYLLKTSRANELVEAVQSVQRGEPVLHPAIAVKVARLWAQRRTSQVKEVEDQISPREREVLDLAARGLRNKAIADRLGISVRTVEGHFNNMLAKLGVSSRLEAVLYAVSHRWITVDGDKQNQA